MAFAREQLDVYRLGLEFLVLAERVIHALPKGRSQLADQLSCIAFDRPEVDHHDGKQMLERIVAILVKLARSFENP